MQVATRKIWETELQEVQARLKSGTEELDDKEFHLAQEGRRSLQLEIAEQDIRGFMNDLQSKLQTVKQNDEMMRQPRYCGCTQYLSVCALEMQMLK
jgi:50S ribosomal subunit-associated GTPase HflX